MEGHYRYIDALRGYAILLVILVHSSQHVPNFDGLIWDVSIQGARGVQLFFVVSAFTLMMSWSRRNDGSVNFYLRRLFRIAPMFWSAIVVYSVYNGVRYGFLLPDVPDVGDVLLSFFF